MGPIGWISWSKIYGFAFGAILILFIASVLPGARCFAKTPPAAPPQAITCGLSESDKIANAKLSVPAFDYAPTTPSTARALRDRGCHAQAAEAGVDYLIRSQVVSERDQSSVIFHIAQNLALSGDERTAAWVVAAAKRPSQTNDASFDWNTYVTGTWAFLRRDRTLLQTAYDRLFAQPGDGNQANAKVLGGLLQCYGEPYASAYSPRCQAGLQGSPSLPR